MSSKCPKTSGENPLLFHDSTSNHRCIKLEHLRVCFSICLCQSQRILHRLLEFLLFRLGLLVAIYCQIIGGIIGEIDVILIHGIRVGLTSENG